MSDSSSDLVPRLLTAAIGIPILLYLIFGAPPWGFYGLVLAAGAVAAWEYCSMTYADEQPGGRILTTLAAAGLVSVFFFVPNLLLEAILAAVTLVTVFFLFAFRDKKRVSHQISASLTALLYGGVLLGILIPIHATDQGPWWIFLTLACVWMSDTSAYFAGRAFGSHPLYKSVSPNKSIEGSIGGVVGSVALFFGFNWLFAYVWDWQTLPPLVVLAVTVPAIILSQIGDLNISLIKRSHEVKDSGSIIYGHGGLLDRIDGLIFAAPWFYVCVVRWLSVTGG